MTEVILVIASAIGFLGLSRMMLSIQAHAWYARRLERVEAIKPWDCNKFHEIQLEYRPIYVQLNDWLVRHHV